MINPALTIGVQILLAAAVAAGIGLMTGPTIARWVDQLRHRHTDITDLLRKEDQHR